MSDASRPEDEGELALGTAQWGMPYGIANRTGVADRNTVRRLLARAKELGVQTLDTARAYGESESVIGELAGADRWWRIVTKLAPDCVTRGESEEAIAARTRESVRSSLDALRRDALDILLLHRASHRADAGGAVWAALMELRESGVVRCLGASARTPEEAWELVDDPEIGAVQVAASVFDRRLERAGFFEGAKASGTTIFVRSIFLQGAAHLSPEALPAHLEALGPLLRTVSGWAKDRDVTMSDVLLGYVRRRLPGVVAVVGCEALEQLEDGARGWRADRLAPDDYDDLAGRLPELPDHVLDPSRWLGR